MQGHTALWQHRWQHQEIMVLPEISVQWVTIVLLVVKLVYHAQLEHTTQLKVTNAVAKKN